MGNSNKPFGKMSKSGEDNFACFLVGKFLSFSKVQPLLNSVTSTKGTTKGTRMLLIKRCLNRGCKSSKSTKNASAV